MKKRGLAIQCGLPCNGLIESDRMTRTWLFANGPIHHADPQPFKGREQPFYRPVARILDVSAFSYAAVIFHLHTMNDVLVFP